MIHAYAHYLYMQVLLRMVYKLLICHSSGADEEEAASLAEILKDGVMLCM